MIPMKRIFKWTNWPMIWWLLLSAFNVFGQFAPGVGAVGTTAIGADSNVFVGWAKSCNLNRGPQNIADLSLGLATAGDSSLALGKADGQTVSLGDGGSAILTFDKPIANGLGWDFAVFENSFDGAFLELSFVEVSSDGVNFFRFPATSHTEDTLQVGTFGDLDPTQINNLAGKYKILYGTPFDLQDLAGMPGLNIDSIVYVKVIDVVGSINKAFATYDQNGRIINDPWPTPFASSGFDLDAVGVIHQYKGATGIAEINAGVKNCSLYPNPYCSETQLHFSLTAATRISAVVTDALGGVVWRSQESFAPAGNGSFAVGGGVNGKLGAGENGNFRRGVYFVHLQTETGKVVRKLIVND